MGWAATRRDLGGRDLHRPARPGGDLPGRGAAGGLDGGPQRRRPRPRRIRDRGGGRGGGALRGHRQPQDPDRRRSRSTRARSASSPRRAPRPSRSRTRSTPRRRSASSTATSTCAGRATTATSALRHQVTMEVRRHLDEQGFYEIETPMLTKSTPEGRARLPGPLAHPPRQLLRPAAVAAALQADPDGGGHGPLLPDRPLLPRRGQPRRPPARVHPGGRRDVVPARSRTSSTSRSRSTSSSAAWWASRSRGRSRASPTPRPWSATAATSPTCASGCRSPT